MAAGKTGERRRRRRRVVAPSAPGTLVVDPEAPIPAIRAMAFDGEKVHTERGLSPAGVAALLPRFATVWIDVAGLGDLTVMSAMGRLFGLHPLSLEDVVNLRQRPKVEAFPTYDFVVLRQVVTQPELHSRQLSLFVGRNFVLTFQEEAGSLVEPLRERLARGDQRVAGADSLAYAIIDALIDQYFPVVEACGERLELLEEELMAQPQHASLEAIGRVRRTLLALRRCIWPLRDELSTLSRQSKFIGPDTQVYLRDCHDHTLVLIDMVETQREIASSLMELYQSSQNNRMNEVMKILTVTSTIFIPLTFIAGVYGMNFNPDVSPYNMPELNWAWGYPGALALMALTALGTVAAMWRKGWLRRQVV